MNGIIITAIICVTLIIMTAMTVRGESNGQGRDKNDNP